MVPDPVVAPRVVKAFELAAQGYSLIEINSQLRLVHQHANLARVLANTVYIGIGRAKGGDIPGICEPLVSEELFWRVQEVRKELSEKYATKTRRPRRLLSGLVVCARCGNNMVIMRPTERTYYRCQNIKSRRTVAKPCDTRLINADHLESAVLTNLREILDDPRIIADVHAEIEGRQDAQSKHQAEIDGQVANLADLERRAGGIVRQLEQLDAVGESSNLLLTRLVELEKEIKREREMLAQIKAKPIDTPRVQDFEEMRASFFSALDHASERKLQLLLRSLQTRVVVLRRDGSTASDEYDGEVEYNLAGARIKSKL